MRQPKKLVNVSELKNAAQTGQGRERVEVKGGKNHTGQSTVKDSQVKESQKGRGDINTLVLHLRAFQTMKEMLKKKQLMIVHCPYLPLFFYCTCALIRTRG